ncbi:MAG: tetratricopeptide repeat protein [bacterium]|nr:tetratricopeptide repeat protein [bacterium]
MRTSGPILLALAMMTGLTGPRPILADEPKPEFVRQMNVGRAHLENRNSAKAIEAFSAAVKTDAASAAAWRNLARSQLLALKFPEALEALSRADRIEAESAATSYLNGLALARLSRFDESVAPFEKAVRLDPKTATLRFQLANTYRALERHDQAVQQLEETIRLDPLHASAHYKLFGYARKAGDRKKFQYHQREFMRLRQLLGEAANKAELLERCQYTLAEPPPLPRQRPAGSPAIPVTFVDASEQVFAQPADRAATAAAILDVDPTGACTVVTVNREGQLALLKWTDPGRLERTRLATVVPATAYTTCLVGDCHNELPPKTRYDPKVHAQNDLLLVGPDGIRLLKRKNPTELIDVTEAAGLAGLTARGAVWLDYEHDGDLDLLLARTTGLELWQNNGNGRFVNAGAQAGLPEIGPAVGVAAMDLEANVAVDVVVARGGRPTLVFENQRTGQFAPMPEPPGPWPPAAHLATDDVDNDGYPDIVLAGTDQTLILSTGGGQRVRLENGPLTPNAVALLDYDNDGWLDLCVAGMTKEQPDGGAIRLWRNLGNGRWDEATEAAGLSALNLPPITGVVSADLDRDGDTDLLVVTATASLHWLRNDGGSANAQLKVRLAGLKTNPAALGTLVEARVGRFWVCRTVGRLPIEIGLGDHRQLDALKTVWTNGVVDNVIDLAVGTEPQTIIEKNVATGSCGFLWAWDGVTYRFINDILGNAPLGLSLRRGQMLAADPDEYVLVGSAEHLPTRNGRYALEVSEEFREVLYVDEVRLVAVDHPPEVEIHSTDKLMPPPFPESELWTLGSPRLPVEAMGDDGIERTAALQAVDGVYAPPGALRPPPLRGVCEPLTITFDFGPVDADLPLVLALTGWIQYGDASRNIAVSQNADLPDIPPMLEVEAAPDVWEPVDLVVGAPAGKTKTILCDLSGKLPDGWTRLRLTTTVELRWDRVALFERLADSGVQRHELPLADARLDWRGFSELVARGPGHPTTGDYTKLSDRPPWRTTLEGWCTRYGDVLDLVTRRDDRLVLLNAGDAMRLEFDAASLPPIRNGWTRTLFFYSVGWDKDGDHNVVGGDLVQPLPVADSPATDADADEWRLQYNTRWVPGDRFAPDR